jgi:hypothetical protein
MDCIFLFFMKLRAEARKWVEEFVSVVQVGLHIMVAVWQINLVLVCKGESGVKQILVVNKFVRYEAGLDSSFGFCFVEVMV